MTTNPVLAIWDAICQASVIGTVGHRLTQSAGPAHPVRRKNSQGEYIDPPPPAWVTDRGCDLVALHASHSATVIHDRRGEDRECGIGAIRRMRLVKRGRSGRVVPIRRTA